METLVHVVDFWFWLLVPTLIIVALITALPTVLLLGLILSGRAREDRS
jgi:uncharacterized membrane protein